MLFYQIEEKNIHKYWRKTSIFIINIVINIIINIVINIVNKFCHKYYNKYCNKINQIMINI